MFYASTPQTDPALLEPIRKTGCYFLTIIHSAAQILKKHFTSLEINNIYNQAIRQNIIRINCFVNHPDKLFNLAGVDINFLGHTGLQFNIDKKQIIIGRVEDPKINFGHFVCLDSNLKIVYDPLNSKFHMKNAELVSCRVFELA